MEYLITWSEEGDSQSFSLPDGSTVYIRRAGEVCWLIDGKGENLTGGMQLAAVLLVLRRKMFPEERGFWSGDDYRTNGGAF